jgi:hypothetical protein
MRCQEPGVFALLPRLPLTGFIGGDDRISQVPARPQSPVRHALRLRQTRSRLALSPRRHGPRSGNDEGFCNNRLSKLNHIAFRLAVYASQRRLPARHARLASGCWIDSTAWGSHPQGLNERFQLFTRPLPPFAGFPWRNPRFDPLAINELS